ncbi:MAG TPA: hypothetical protein VKH45_04455 [Candidatus Acidoferrum sp.]|nr:hypothetical protein [Candidatus Acidoferrum sp.]
MDAGLQTLFECLLTVQFVVVVAHDLVDIPGWTHGSQVQALIGRRKLLLVTLINGIFPGFAAAFALFYWNCSKPRFVLNYSVIYCAGTVAFAITMWYVPYIFGGSKKQKRDYADIYAGTRQVLPARGDNPRANLLHRYFHALFAINLAFALALRLGKL